MKTPASILIYFKASALTICRKSSDFGTHENNNFCLSQVSAHDKDGSNVVYTGITGDDDMEDSLELDRITGDIIITDNSHLDRETKDSKLMLL